MRELSFIIRDVENSLYESLLDDEDIISKGMDKAVEGKWFDVYAKGNFKIKDKKSSLGPTIIGNIIIDNYDGETIPVSVWEVKGNVYFTNCPKLKTINGFFGRGIGIDGGLYIENCPNLESLEGCPKLVDDFSLIGCKKIKSLIGAPEHVFGNVYIMKNGKKFTEEQIRSVIEISKRVDCNEENENANICEALTEPHLLKLDQYLKTKGSNLKQIMHIVGGFAFDKITSKDVETFTRPNIDEDALKKCRKIISGKNRGFILLRNSKIDGFTLLINHDKRSVPLSGYKLGRIEYTNSTELINACKTAGEVTIFYYNEELDTWNKKTDRRLSKEGMILNDKIQNEKIARENIKRYKEILRTNRAKRNIDFEKIDQDVENILMRVLKLTQKAHRDPEKYNEYTISRINEMVYDQTRYDRGKTHGSDGLLYVYNTYTSNFISLRRGSKYEWEEKSMNNAKIKLENIIKKLDKELTNQGV